VRNLFICFLMATLAALVQRGPNPVVEPATYLGLLVVFPVLGARLFRNWRLSPAVGALAAGAILSQSGLMTSGTLESVAAFKDAGFIWLGLYLGTQAARRSAWRAQTVTPAIAIVVTCSLFVCLSTSLFRLTLLEQLQIGLAAAACAPLFTMLEPQRHPEALGLSVMSAAIAGTLLAATAVTGVMTENARAILTAPIVLLLAVEFAFRCLRSAVSGPGRYAVLILVTATLWKTASQVGVHPALMGLSFGFLLGLRTHRWQDTTTPLAEASTFVCPFVVGFLASGLDWGRLVVAPAEAWTIAAAIACPMVLAKVLVGRFVGQNVGYTAYEWLTLYPLGIAAIEVIPAVLPTRLLLGVAIQPIDAVLPTILISTVALPLLFSWVGRWEGYFSSRRHAAASSGGIGLT